jgi:NAD(P)-dependent dehydrogenase (short-subunit alcohol dehydrogenase family)
LRATAQQSAEQTWPGSDDVIASLSVRSGLDLMLGQLGLPAGSEVLVSAVTIEDMVTILRHHGLVAVPMDVNPTDMSPSLKDIDRAITSRTKAMLIAHLFGTRLPLQPFAEKAQERVKSLCDAGHQAVAFVADATIKAELESALKLALSNFGRVDILLNAAGINSGTPFFEIGEAEWDRILNVNVHSVYLACQVFGKHMVEAGNGGSIINISSASSDPPLSRVFTYSISKSGVNQITKYLAREWASHRVRVNAILPGFFVAEQNRALLSEERVASILSHTPMRRFGEPAELVGAALYLASERPPLSSLAQFARGRRIGAMTI